MSVTSILSNPNQDPHLFEASDTRIVVYNGIDYDPWMAKLVGASSSNSRRIIIVATLAGRKTGDNPHVWYDTQTMLAFAAMLTEVLAQEDPPNATNYHHQLAQFQAAIEPIQAKLARLGARVAGTPVTATAPIFGYMLEALGMRSRNLSFQLR